MEPTSSTYKIHSDTYAYGISLSQNLIVYLWVQNSLSKSTVLVWQDLRYDFLIERNIDNDISLGYQVREYYEK